MKTSRGSERLASIEQLPTRDPDSVQISATALDDIEIRARLA
jgi:hypothetical protein